VTASLLAGLAHAQISGLFVMPVSQALAILVIGWLWGIHMTSGHEAPGGRPASRSSGWVPAFAAAAGALALLPGFAATFPHLEKATASYMESDRGNFRPRMWLQGDICLRPWPDPARDPVCQRTFQGTEPQKP
jgi:hypothetical protein